MNKFRFLKKGKINQLPKASGVYAFHNRKEILYIGKATNIRERVKNHFHPVKYREAVILLNNFAFSEIDAKHHLTGLFNRVKQIGYIQTDSEIEALILEANLIKKYQPKYNVVWRDDKNYFFVAKTVEDFPRIFITHQPKQKLEIRNLKLEINYTGPFVDGKVLRQALKVLRKVFPYRSCRALPKRPCLWYQLGRCLAPCLLKSKLGEQIPGAGIRMERESQRNTKNLLKILNQGKIQVLKNLKKEMEKASKNQDYETAGKIRDQIEALEKVIEHAKIFEPQIIQITPWCKMYNRIEKRLRKILGVKNKISRIEAYDISNIQGKLATGSMVTFIRGLPDKNFYRKFRIHPVKSAGGGAKQFNGVKISGKPDDVAMIKETLSRRLRHPEWPYPDLILIDGGRAQLNAALKVKNQNSKVKNIKVISLAKKENKLFIEGRKQPILLKNLPREIFNLILRLRDEAHRFARKYHHKLREIDTFN